jgi:CBS domain-containing protein
MDIPSKIGTKEERRYVRDFLSKIRLTEVMTKDVIYVQEYDPFSIVEEKFRIHGIRHLPVLGTYGRLVGVISQRDLYRICPPRIDANGQRFYTKEDLDGYILRRVMTPDPLALKENDSLADALFKMAETRFGSVIVVSDKNHLRGIITHTDIIKAAVRILKE